MKNNMSCRGFTLLEILVALAIFALISLVCYRQIDVSARTSAHIEQRYVALWIAENQLEEMFVNHEFPSAGETKNDIEVASQKWTTRIRVETSDIENLNRIDVTVYSDEKYEKPILTLTRFIGKK